MDQVSYESNQFCKDCGVVDEKYDENSGVPHENSVKHKCNGILRHFHSNESFFASNRGGINVSCKLELTPDGSSDESVAKKIWADVKPNKEAKYVFKICMDKKADYVIVGVQLGHPQPQFLIKDDPFPFEQGPYSFPQGRTETLVVKFMAENIGQYEMPIFFTFRNLNPKKNKNNKVERDVIIMRKMAASVREIDEPYLQVKSPYTHKFLPESNNFIKSVNHTPHGNKFKMNPNLKKILPYNLEGNPLERHENRLPRDKLEELRETLNKIQGVLLEGTTKDNYIDFFQHLLWWEEIIGRINLKKYNMKKVKIERRADGYYLNVPGLAEKRPSLLLGDRVLIQPCHDEGAEYADIIFESIIKKIEDEHVKLGDLQSLFAEYYSQTASFGIRFLMSLVTLERMHEAVTTVFKANQASRIFPEPNTQNVPVKTIHRFFNPLVRENREQRCAVENIVSGCSGTAPYIVYGPPGTGKTVSIVEAILQLVAQNGNNRIMVCTGSNMAADHIALVLLKYKDQLNMNNFLLRANSKSRSWSVMPSELTPYSNGDDSETCYSVSNTKMSSYKIVVTTLFHAAKYINKKPKLVVSHLFIDEAAQASEPTSLVPVSGLLAERGQLVLAGDPRQLGPVCDSRQASKKGLGTSLLERLQESYPQMYSINPGEINHKYITILLKNFRSHPDIISISNALFYQSLLQPVAPFDKLSTTNILGEDGGDRAVVFHDIHAKEQRMKNTPSYFNEKELDMLKIYIKALVDVHGVLPKDIGIVTPYIRQVYKMKSWLLDHSYQDMEVGTVESFQGKEKRVILVSTVRANCRLLDYDAKYSLGFLVDDKRFNVTLTRARAKLIIVGNSTCLKRDRKWRIYMDKCKQYNCYYGASTQQLPRDSKLLTEVSITRFEKCHLSEALGIQ